METFKQILWRCSAPVFFFFFFCNFFIYFPFMFQKMEVGWSCTWVFINRKIDLPTIIHLTVLGIYKGNNKILMVKNTSHAINSML